jgi:hypothetical protein
MWNNLWIQSYATVIVLIQSDADDIMQVELLKFFPPRTHWTVKVPASWDSFWNLTICFFFDIDITFYMYVKL